MIRLLLLTAAAALVAGAPAAARAADGELVSSRACVRHPLSYADYVAERVKDYRSEAELGAKAGVPQPQATNFTAAMPTRAEYQAMITHPFACRAVFYGSDGLKVAAYIWEPAKMRPGAHLPVVVNLRGGNGDLGKFAPDNSNSVPPFVDAGFVVIGVQYRGVDGGEGVEQFGGDDVHDVVNAVALARRLPEADPRNVFLYGSSRGAMMVYLAVRDGAKVNAAVTVSGFADLELEARRRPMIEANVFRKLIPDYDRDRSGALARRSGVLVAKQVDLPPMLIMHGTADWRADPRNSFEVAEALQARGRPYELHIFDDDIHGIFWHWRERNRLSVEWFREHMVR